MKALCRKTVDRCSAADAAAVARAKLAAHPHRQLRQIDCDLHEELWVLRGVVSSFYLKQLAQAAVAGVGGIFEVRNCIEVRYEPLDVSSRDPGSWNKSHYKAEALVART